MANEKINILVEAQDKASAPLKNVRNNIDGVSASAKNTAQQARNLGGSLGGVGRGAGQAGIQVQQFVGQIQGGVNPMVALSQQATDLGFVLGVPLVGAIVGISASIAAALLPSLLAASKSFADLAKEVKAVGLDLEDLPTEVIIAETDRLTEAMKDAKDALNSQNEAVRKATERLKEEENILRRVGLSEEDVAKQTLGLRSEVDRLSESIPQLTSDLIISTARLKNFAGEFRGASAEIKTFTYETDRFIRRARKNLYELPPVVLDTDPITSDISKIWQETDKVTTSFHRLGEEVKMTAMDMDDVGKRGLTSMEDGLVDLINGTKSASEAFKSMANSIINDLIRMYIQRQITAPLFNAMFGASATTYTTVSGSANPTVGNPDVYFEGGGFTGRGSRSGGVDGKGGFNAILHPNVTVIDHTKGQGMGAPVNVTLNISTGVAQTVRAEIANLLPQITNATKAAVVDARRRGGSFAGAFGA